jgi:hypothetical protein
MQFAARLRLYYKLVVDNQIEPLDTKTDFLVQNPHRHFASNTMSACAELFFHGPHVQVFEESVPERVVNLEKRTNS